MATISDIVKIKSGYANFVEMKSSFEEDQDNLERMAMYRPTTAHRKAFERLCRGLSNPTDKKFYLLTGSYGTGKSHLCLMFANFLSRSSGDTEVSGFYDNYEKLDPVQGKTLRNLRKGGQYLVAICDYNSGQNFEDVVLRAVIEACEAKGIESLVQTRHDEAERLLSDWEGKSADVNAALHFYANFTKVLEKIAPSITVDQLREGLRNYDSSMLGTFKSAYREALGGIEFQSQAGNIIPIIKKLVKSDAFKSRFKGLAVLFDEFGFTLEKAAYSKDILQGFMEKICQNEPNILFVGCIHKDFTAYADKFSKDDAKVMSARITHVPLLNEGIEEIIGAIVETDKDSPAWKSEVEPKLGVLDAMLPKCETLQLFPWIKETQRIRKRVLEDIYGVHPVALACLLKLSAEIGSDARSTFTFFTGDIDKSQGSYAEFIQDADLTVDGGKLNLYTVAGLYSFFEKELDPKNNELRDVYRQQVNGYISSEFTFRKSQQSSGELFATENDPRIIILKIILLYQLCKIPTSADNIFFGLYGMSAERKQLDKQLKYLDKVGAIFFRKQSKTYELAAASGEDPYDLIGRYVDDPQKHPADMVESFLAETGEKTGGTFLEAKQYNLTYNEDKRFRRIFKRAKDLGPALWQDLLDEMEEGATDCNKSYEGVAVYVLCKDETDIKVAKDAVNSIPGDRIVVSVPHEAQSFSETLLKVKACRYYLQTGEAEKLNTQTEIRFRDIFENSEDGLLPRLKKIMEQIVSGELACWYGKEGTVIVDMPPQSHKPADSICELLFTSRCRIKHADLNQVHNNKWKNGKNTALKQAVNVLLGDTVIQIDNGNPENHGEKKYLEKVLFKKAGALKKIKSEDNVTFFEGVGQADKIQGEFPVLKELCQRLNDLSAGKTLQIGSFIQEMKRAPWGAGETQLILAIAQAVATFGEKLRIYKDSTKMVEESLEEYSKLEQVLFGPAAKLVFEIKEISDVQKKLIEKISAAVYAPKLLHGEQRSLASACDTLKFWWKDLSQVAKVKTVYDKNDQERIETIKMAMDKIADIDRYEIIFGVIPGLYGEDQVIESDAIGKIDRIVVNFEKDVALLDSGENRARKLVAEVISRVFGTEGDIVQCEKVVKEWYEGLNPNQRDVTRYETEPDAQVFISQLAHPDVPYERKLMKMIPDAFGLNAVSNWDSLRTDDYVSKLTHAKKEVEDAAIVVPVPEIVGKQKCSEAGDGRLKLDEGGSIEIKVVEGLSLVVYTVNGEDPRNSSSSVKISKNEIVSDVFANKPAVKIKARGIDGSGNYSDLITCDVINKEKEYGLDVGGGNLFSRTGTFKIPDTSAALKTVLGSIVDQALKDSVVNGVQAQQLKDGFDKL